MTSPVFLFGKPYCWVTLGGKLTLQPDDSYRVLFPKATARNLKRYRDNQGSRNYLEGYKLN